MLAEKSIPPQFDIFVNYTKLPEKEHVQYRKLIKSHTTTYNNRRRPRRVKAPSEAESLGLGISVEHLDETYAGPDQSSQCKRADPISPTKSGDIIEDERSAIIRHCPNPDINLSLRARLPIEGTGRRIPYLYDYYIHNFGPTYMWRVELLSAGTPRAVDMFKKSFLQLIMQDSVVFEATMSLCQAQLDWNAAPASKPSKYVLQHYGSVLKGLRQKLNSPNVKVGSSLILTVMGLMTLDHMYGNWRSFEANLKGLRQIIALRGTFDPLGLFGFEEYALASYEVSWEMHLSQTTKASWEEHAIALTYLDHPFPVNVCEILAKLPQGFRELALSRALSVQVIELIARVTDRLKLELREGHRTGEQGVRATKEAKTCAWLLSLEVGPIEELICIGIIAHLEPFNGQCSRPMTPMRRRGIENLTPKLEKIDLWEMEKIPIMECVAWVAMVVAAISDSETLPLPNRWLLLDRIMASQEHIRTWTAIRRVLQKFFWIDSFEEKWKEIWEIAKMRMEDGSGNKRTQGTS